MIQVSKAANALWNDFMLNRYACYLLAQNGDPQTKSGAELLCRSDAQAVLIEDPACACQTRIDARDRCANPKNLVSRTLNVAWTMRVWPHSRQSDAFSCLVGHPPLQMMKTNTASFRLALWPTFCPPDHRGQKDVTALK